MLPRIQLLFVWPPKNPPFCWNVVVTHWLSSTIAGEAVGRHVKRICILSWTNPATKTRVQMFDNAPIRGQNSKPLNIKSLSDVEKEIPMRRWQTVNGTDAHVRNCDDMSDLSQSSRIRKDAARLHRAKYPIQECDSDLRRLILDRNSEVQL